ncbi:MAG: T9SS type A sorting domain-containing protein [Flavobacteriales bacterium]|nr:T9SS type A sorting domain-containing protein [Flavobacteriales bacterium]
MISQPNGSFSQPGSAAFLLASSILFVTPARSQTVTDIDGNVYNTVTINGRTWMAENLATSRYQDGTPIPVVASNTTWFNQISGGARCFFWNDSALVAQDYGTLYNWNVVNNTRNVCPTGWHVPSDTEWSEMTIFLDPTVSPNAGAVGPGTGTDIGTQLKEEGEVHWDVGNTGTNSSGFTARGAGYRRSNGTFEYLTAFAYFWTSTYGEQSKAWIRSVNFNDPTIARFILDRLYGASIRCIADLSTGEEEIPDSDLLRLFPNPATGSVRISGLPEGLVDIVMTDASGKQVQRQQLNGTDRRISVDDLAPGVYVLSATMVSGEWHARLKVE